MSGFFAQHMHEIAAGGIAGAFATVATHPMDRWKTLRQLVQPAQTVATARAVANAGQGAIVAATSAVTGT